MLSGLTKKLSQEFDIVGVLARYNNRLAVLQNYSVAIIAIQADYTDLEDLKSKLDEFTGTYSIPEIIVSWVHSTSPDATVLIAQYCDNDFYEVTGESGKESDHISRTRQDIINKFGINYHRVILGHIGDRWLNNQEISDGVYKATHAKIPEFIVGNI